jgi:hypothetical protein
LFIFIAIYYHHPTFCKQLFSSNPQRPMFTRVFKLK